MTHPPQPGADDVLYVVDLSTWLYRSFHATPPFRSPKTDEPCNAVKGVMQLLVRILVDREPAFLTFAFDSPGKTFRHEIDPRYKQDRKPRPPDLDPQIDATLALLEMHGIPCLRAASFEADDIIATVCREARERELRVVIVALDKDLLQLVRGDVVVQWDARDRWLGGPEVETKFGVPAELLVDLMALMGDPTDGIPGIAGVGRKTAAKLLGKRGSLDEVLRKADWESTPAMRAKLRDGAEDARLSRQLVTLRDDVPVPFDLSAMRPGWDDAEPIRRRYVELGFDALAADVRPMKKRPLPARLR